MSTRHYSPLKLSTEFAIMTVSLLQRNPIVMRPVSRIENEYAKYRANLESEKSRGTFRIGTGANANISNAPDTKLFSALLSSGENENSVDMNEHLPPSNLSRHLHRKLYFCLKEASNGQWTLPTARFIPDTLIVHENQDINNNHGNPVALHHHAQSILSNILAPSEGLQLYHIGAAPVAFHQEIFTDRVVHPLGAKHFFFRSQLVGGKVRVSSKYREFGWFCKEELENKLTRDLFESIEPVLTE